MQNLGKKSCICLGKFDLHSVNVDAILFEIINVKVYI